MNAVSVSPEPTARPRAVRSVLTAAAIGLAGAITAYLTTVSPQLAATVVLAILVVCLYARSLLAGLTALWVLWLVIPMIRRVFELTSGYQNADPLSLLPFLATGLIGGHIIVTGSFSRRAKLIMAAPIAGWLVGVPAGLKVPASDGFALFAYVSCLTAFALGYHERPRQLKKLSLYRALILASPVLAAYGITQYFLPLTSWDDSWLKNTASTFDTVGSPQKGHIRVFASLNSPGTLAVILGLAVICYLASRRITLASVVGLVIVLVGLGLTYVRSSWLATIVSAFVFVLVSRGAALRRVLPIAAVLVLALPVLGNSNATVAAVVGRADTFGSLGGDTSANARLATPTQLALPLLFLPLGVGLGQAGEASRLGQGQGLRASDNGYLALLYQTGPFGTLLVLAGMFAAFSSSTRMALRRGAPRGDVLVFVLLAFGLVALLSGDYLYGVSGAIFWYLLGSAVASEETKADVVTPVSRSALPAHAPA